MAAREWSRMPKPPFATGWWRMSVDSAGSGPSWPESERNRELVVWERFAVNGDNQPSRVGGGRLGRRTR
jgi:hypothetical protein